MTGAVTFPSGGDLAGMTGAGGGSTITGGGLGFSFDSRTAAQSASITAAGSGGPNWIRTNGYATAGDGGHGLYVRVGTTPAYSSLIWFSSADGQKWGLVLTAEPLRPEQAGGGTTATGTQNNNAVDALHSIYYTNKTAFPSGYTYAGPCIRFGPGTYNFASPYFIKGGSNISGSGSGMYGGYATELKFPAGSDGLVLGAFQSNGRLYSATAYGDYDARGSIIRDLSIQGGWTGGTTYMQDHTTGQRGIGILTKGICTLENLHINKFAEFGVYLKGSVDQTGASSEPAFGTGDNTDPTESYVAGRGAANSFMFIRVACETCGNDGFRIKGSDANAGSIISCSSTENVGWGFNDLCFLGNDWFGNHAASNGTGDGIDFWSGKQYGAYQCYGESQFTTFVANYSEGDYPGRNSYFTGYHLLIGGLMAGGFHSSSVGVFPAGGGAIRMSPQITTTLGGDYSVGQANVDNEILNINGEIFTRREFGVVKNGTFGISDVNAITLSSYSSAQGRSSALGGGNQLFPYGFWIGGPQINTGFDQRFTGMSDGLPSAGKWARGDFIRMVNPSAGGAWAYVCTTGGDYAGTPPVWKSVGNLAA